MDISNCTFKTDIDFISGSFGAMCHFWARGHRLWVTKTVNLYREKATKIKIRTIFHFFPRTDFTSSTLHSFLKPENSVKQCHMNRRYQRRRQQQQYDHCKRCQYVFKL